MSESKKLTRRQAAVIEDLFTSDLKEPEILEKHSVKRHEYARWLADEHFTEQLEQRMAHAHRQARIVLARHTSKAADRLIALTTCEREETARKACLDIIALNAGQKPSIEADVDPEPIRAVPPSGGLTPEIAGRLLAALAGARQDDEDASPSP